jgi:hypothetical protein
MSLTPLDFIYNDSQDLPDYFEVSSPIVYSDHSWSFKYNPPSSVDYNVKYKSHFTNMSATLTLDKISNHLNSYVSQSVSESSNFFGYELNYLNSDLFLPGVRYLSPGIIVFERPPSFHYVSLSMDYRDGIDDETTFKEWYIPIPWQVYIAAYNPNDMRLVETRMFFSNSSLFDSQQHLYAPPIFNFYSNAKLCRPFFDSIEDIEKYPQTISGVIASAFDWIWNSGFNLDITENISEFIFTKKYTQFEKYLTTPEQKKAYQHFVIHPLSGVGSSLHRSYISPFFTCWESVPIEDISTFNWSPYSVNDFFYQDYRNNSDLSELIDEYINIHDLIVHEYEDGHYDDCDEEYCPDNCITEEDLINSDSFRTFVADKKKVENKSIHIALQQTVDVLKNAKIAQNSMQGLQYSKIHQISGQKLFSDS